MPAQPDAETLLATILEGIGMPFYAVDKDWRIYIYNGHAARHFGRTAEQMIGTTVWENFPQDIDAERGRILQNAMSRRETVTGETRRSGPSIHCTGRSQTAGSEGKSK